MTYNNNQNVCICLIVHLYIIMFSVFSLAVGLAYKYLWENLNEHMSWDGHNFCEKTFRTYVIITQQWTLSLHKHSIKSTHPSPPHRSIAYRQQ